MNVFSCAIKTSPELYSAAIARNLHKKIFQRTGYYPKLLINKVHPSKLDVDVARDEGTFDQDLPMALYDEYHDNMEAGLGTFTGPGLVISVRTYNIDGENRFPLGK